jgi:hypothetical protein
MAEEVLVHDHQEAPQALREVWAYQGEDVGHEVGFFLIIYLSFCKRTKSIVCSYEEMRVYFKNPAYINTTKNMLFRLVHICNDLHGDDTSFIGEVAGKARQSRPVLSFLQSSPIAESAIKFPGFLPFALAVNKRKRDQGETARAMANKIELPPMVKLSFPDPGPFLQTNQESQQQAITPAIFQELCKRAHAAVHAPKESSDLSMLAEMALRTATQEDPAAASRLQTAQAPALRGQAAAWAPIVQALSSSVGSSAQRAPVLQAQAARVGAGPARSEIQPTQQAPPAQPAPPAQSAQPSAKTARWILARKTDGKPPVVATTHFANAYLIVYHRQQICNFMGKADERIYKSAKEMLELFDILLAALKDGKDLRTLGAEVTGEFMPKVFQYMADFEDWFPQRRVSL